MTNAAMLNFISHLLRLIEAKDWETFRSYALEPSPAHFRARVNAISKIPEFNGMTLLHAVVRCDPPLDLVLEMIEICPHLKTAKDCLGRTPLHIAAGCSASPLLIRIFARICPAACDIQDIDGKTPLHFACDSSCELFEEEDDASVSKTSRELSYDSISALLSASLVAATLEDIDEMTPLEHAIMSGASMETIKLLQHASVTHLRGPCPDPTTPDDTRRVSVVASNTSMRQCESY